MTQDAGDLLSMPENSEDDKKAQSTKSWQVGQGWITTLSGESFAMLNEILLFGANPDSVDEALTFLAE